MQPHTLIVSNHQRRAAVYFEMGEYEKVVADCTSAVERGRELRADYKMVARALTRKGNALVKMGDLPAAIEAYHKALTEHRCARFHACFHLETFSRTADGRGRSVRLQQSRAGRHRSRDPCHIQRARELRMWCVEGLSHGRSVSEFDTAEGCLPAAEACAEVATSLKHAVSVRRRNLDMLKELQAAKMQLKALQESAHINMGGRECRHKP